MSTVSAKKFGNQVRFSQYGDYLRANDGNGMLKGEMIESANTDLDTRLFDIQAMRSEMSRCPQSGDDRVVELLDFDEILIRNGLASGDYESTLDMYPDLPADLPEYMATITREDTGVYEQISRVLGEEDGARWFVQAPIELLSELDRTQSSDILQALLDGATARQFAAYAHEKTINADTHEIVA